MQNHREGMRGRARINAYPWLGFFLIASISLPVSNAAAYTLGSLAPPNLGSCGNCNTFQVHTVPGQPHYRVPPGDWLIVSWSAQGGGTTDGMARLRVYRPLKVQGRYIVVRESALELVKAAGHPTFSTHLRVKGGDLLGVFTQDNLAAGYSNSSTAGATDVVPTCGISGVGDIVGAGTSCELLPLSDHLANVKATLKKLP